MQNGRFFSAWIRPALWRWGIIFEETPLKHQSLLRGRVKYGSRSLCHHKGLSGKHKATSQHVRDLYILSWQCVGPRHRIQSPVWALASFWSPCHLLHAAQDHNPCWTNGVLKISWSIKYTGYILISRNFTWCRALTACYMVCFAKGHNVIITHVVSSSSMWV